MNHILVVDDSPVDRALAGGLLEQLPQRHVQFASHGLEALEQLEARLPLAIVTDLQMPEMDGLALVAAVRKQYPQIPVILMTAHGSEEIALQALLAGAADFVPKSRLAVDLRRAVEMVLTVCSSDLPHQRLSHCLRYEQQRYEVENDVSLIPPLVGQLQQPVLDLGLVDPTDRMRLSKALVEALRNAVYHGNLELPAERVTAIERAQSTAADMELAAERRRARPYCDRRVHVEAVVSQEEARFTIRDEGAGFDTAHLPNLRDDPSHLSRCDGRGLFLIRAFMDDVQFNDRGNEITLVKRATTERAGEDRAEPSIVPRVLQTPRAVPR